MQGNGNEIGVPKIKRGGFLIIVWKGDHAPYHCHVFKDGREIAKINLEAMVPMKGTLNAKLRKTLESLLKEGLI